ncbi:hypothetical protein DFH29DRAFT_1004533 [Suillus ampliporus]|nr:hypothetical protein DFH29DRAFT_1004533 [Suillus ampliporus]
MEAPPSGTKQYDRTFSLTISTIMAPPIKYKTHTAKLQAERAKHHRHYEKRRDAILAKCRQLCKDRNTRDDDNNHSDDNDEPIHTLSDCIAVVKLAKDDFMQHIKSPQTFIIGVLAKYTKSIPDTPVSLGDREILKDAMSSIEDFLDRASRGQDGILQLCGVNDKWRAADQVCRCMRDTIAMVEDTHCLTISDGDSGLAEAHSQGELLYQNYKDQ